MPKTITEEHVMEYFQTVTRNLEEMSRLAENIGLNGQAVTWLVINGIFHESLDEIAIFCGMMGIYLDKKIKAIKDAEKISRSVQLSESNS